MSADPKLPETLLLKDLIRKVKSELVAAMKEGEDNKEQALLGLSSATLEINFTVQNEESVDGSFSAKLFAVVSAKAGGTVTYSKEQVHKITLELTPLADGHSMENAKRVHADGSSSSGGRDPVSGFQFAVRMDDK